MNDANGRAANEAFFFCVMCVCICFLSMYAKIEAHSSITARERE